MKYQNLISNLSILRKLLLISTSLLCLSSIPSEASSFEEAERPQRQATRRQGFILGQRRYQESESFLLRKTLLSSLHAREDISLLLKSLRPRLQALPQETQAIIKQHFKELLEQDKSLAPHNLLRSTHLLTNPQLSPSHICFERLNDIMNSLKELVQASSLKEVAPLFQELHDYYQAYQARLCQIAPHERVHFLSAIPLKSPGFPQPMLISQEMAYELLSMDEYGLVIKQNKEGSSPTIKVGGVYSKRAVFITEASLDQESDLSPRLSKRSLLDPGMESAIYAFNSRLFGEGIVPSTLLIFPQVKHCEAAASEEGKRVQEVLDEANSPNLSAPDRRRARNRIYEDDALKAHIVETTSSFTAQVSLAIEGELLGNFLGNAQENLDLFKTLDQGQVQRLLITLMLTNSNDAKEDNFIVTQGERNRKIIGIDNDLSFAGRIVTQGHGQIHFPEVRNLLFMIPAFMDQPLLPDVKAHFLSHDPTLFLLGWLRDLKAQNQQYKTLEADIGEETFNLLRLPFKLRSGTLERLHGEMTKLQKMLLAHTETTPHHLLETLSPLLALYYEKARYKSPDSLTLFKRIYNGDYKAQISEMLKGETHLSNGQLIQEALNQEKDFAKAYQHRPQPLIEALRELIDPIDPTTLLPQTLQNLLEDLLATFPEALEHVLFKTPFSCLLKASILPALLDTYFMLFPERLEAGEDVSFLAPLHQAIEHKNVKIVTYLLEKKVSPNQRNPNHHTPLDLACEQGNEEIFKILIEADAHKVNPDRALTFYHKLAPTSPTILSFIKLARRHQELQWLLSIQQLLPKKGQGMAIQTTSLGNQALSQELYDQLFTEKGEVKAENTSGRHAVGRLTLALGNLPLTLYFKAYPELPGLEEAVGEFTRRLLGFGAPYAELLRVEGTPVLMSQGIQGPTLAHVLREAPEFLNHLDEEALSSLYLATMLVNPEDGKADNYIVETLPTGKVRLIAIDNDHAFVPAVAKQQKKSFLRAEPVVQVKSILYCLDQFQSPLSPAAREQLLSINSGKMLEGWLRFLRARNALYGEMFSEQERLNLLKKDSYIGIPFPEGAIRHLYQKIQRMQEVLGRHSDITHAQLLKLLEPELAHRYSKGFEKPASVLERFQLIDGPFYGKSSSGEPYTFTTSGHILKAMNIPLKESLLSLARQDSKNTHDFRPNKALQELKEILGQHQQVALSKVGVVNAQQLQSLPSEELRQALSQQDFAKMPLNDQRALFELLKGRRFEELILKNAAGLTNKMVMTYPQLDSLLSLNLSGCKALTDKILEPLAKGALGLIYLNLSELPYLKVVGKGSFFARSYIFPALKTLILNSSGVYLINLEMPSLITLEAQNCSKLATLKIRCKQLQNLSLSYSPKVSKNDLAEVILDHSELQQLGVESGPQIYFDPNLKIPNPINILFAKHEGSEDFFREFNYVTIAKEHYKKSLLNNSAIDQVNLGLMYLNGNGVEKDEAQAALWFRKAAEQGFAYGQFFLGSAYQSGCGVDKDEAQALDLYLKSANQGNANAQFSLGLMYFKGDNIEKDEIQAASWALKAADQGDAHAQSLIGLMYEQGKGVEKDENQAVYWYRKAAEQGDARTQSFIGLMYEQGKGVEKDENQAVYWYRKAAEQGDAAAFHNLACLYFKGCGVEQDCQQALLYFTKAAEQNISASYQALAEMYFHGKGVPRDEIKAQDLFNQLIHILSEKNEPLENYDYRSLGVAYYYQQDFKKAFHHFQQGADKEDSSSHTCLGTFYKEGLSVPQDLKLALEHFQAATDQNNSDAFYNLGVMYRDGEGVAQDDLKAISFFQKAADLQSGNAQYALGWMYQEGRGVAKDLAKARQLFTEAKRRYAHEVMYDLGRMYELGLRVEVDQEKALFYYQQGADLNDILAKRRLANLGMIRD